MNYLLLYELSNREFDNLVLIKQELVKRGHKVEIRSKYTDFSIKYEKCVVLVPNAYCNSDIDYYRYNFNLRDNAIVVYPCEQAINRKMPEFFDASEANNVKKLPTLCWGDDYYDFIQKLGYKNIYNNVVGAVHLDYCRPEFKNYYYSKDEIAERYGINKEKKWLLFISDFVFQNADLCERYIEEGSLTKTAVYAIKDYERDLQSQILEWFESFLRENNEFVIIYRKHPMEIKNSLVEALEKEFPENFMEITQLGITQWIMLADRICTYNSTAIVECAVADKECLLLRPKEFPKESGMEDYPFYKGYPRIKTYDEFYKAITLNEKNLDYIKSKIDYQYSIDNKRASERVADILETIANDQYKNECDMSNYTFKRILYLLKTGWHIKIVIKKIYTMLCQCVGGFEKKEGLLATKEWKAVRNNKKRESELVKRIEKIIGEQCEV